MIEQIEEIVCAGEGLEPEEIHVPSRETLVKEARQIVMYLAKIETRLPQRIIGAYFGLDHATSYNAFVRISNLIKTEPLFKLKIDEYQKQVKEVITEITKEDVITATFNSLVVNINIMEVRLLSMQKSLNKLKIELENLK